MKVTSWGVTSQATPWLGEFGVSQAAPMDLSKEEAALQNSLPMHVLWLNRNKPEAFSAGTNPYQGTSKPVSKEETNTKGFPSIWAWSPTSPGHLSSSPSPEPLSPGTGGGTAVHPSCPSTQVQSSDIQEHWASPCFWLFPALPGEMVSSLRVSASWVGPGPLPMTTPTLSTTGFTPYTHL